MKTTLDRLWTVGVMLAVGGVFLQTAAHAQVNTWTNLLSGVTFKWEDGVNWSLGISPSSNQSIFVTNAASLSPNLRVRNVNIDATTAGSFAFSMFPNNLTVSAPRIGSFSSFNTLVVTNSSSTPFVIINTCTISTRGTIFVSNSTMAVDGTGNFTNLIDDGTFILDSGSLLTSNGVAAVIGQGGTGILTVSDGTWAGYAASLGNASGASGTLNIAGGTTTLAFRLSVGASAGGAGTVLMTGGQLTVSGGDINGVVNIGDSGTGQMTVSNGTWLVQGSENVNIGAGTLSQGMLTIAGGTSVLSTSLNVAPGQNSTGVVSVTGGQLIVTNGPTILGSGGAAQMTISNGTWRGRDVYLGTGSGSQGTLTIAGGTSTLASMDIGETTAACSVWLTGGQLTVTNNRTVIANGPAGQMTVSNGTWLSTDVLVSAMAGSQGTLTIAGGTNTLVSTLDISIDLRSTGTVWMTGGQLTVTNSTTFIGDFGPGQMTVSNGTWRARSVTVANNTDSQGTLTWAGGTNILTSAVLNVGFDADAMGTVWMVGGLAVVTNSVVILGNGGVGQMTVSNGAWQVYGSLTLGNVAGSQGTLTMAGGTNLLASASSPAQLILGNGATAVGTVWMTDGLWVLTNASTIIGNAGVGQMTISNGTWLAHDVIVANTAGSWGTLTAAGGTGSVFSNLTIGNFPCTSTGIVNVAGGALYVTNAAGNAVLEVRSGTLTLSSGLLNVDRFVMTNACAHFVRTGGTLVYGTAVLNPNDDTDGDGIPNGYEQSHGLDPLNPADASADNDGDGLSNLQEYLAGTDPNSAASAFRITSIAKTNANLLVTWMTGVGKTNALEATAGSVNGSYTTNNFITIFTVTNTVSTVTNYLDVGGATNKPARYYRVRLVP